MTGRYATVDLPAAGELLSRVEEFIEQELVPLEQDAKLRYRLRIAANLLRIARREIEQLGSMAIDRDGHAVPHELLAQAGSLRELSDDLYAGRRNLTDPAVYALVLNQVTAKLRIADPGSLDEGTAGADIPRRIT